MGAAPVAVVTGGSAGVGRAVVREFADRGFDVAVLARGAAGLAGAVADVEARGRRAVAIEVDVAGWDDMDRAATRVEEVLGPIDVWVNNAMVTVFSWSWDVEPDEYRRATEVNYLGVVHGTLVALHRMRPRDRGRIVNVGSALSYLGIPLQAPYCASKFAVRGFTESVRAELVHEGSPVVVSEVHLPAVNTPQFDWSLAKLDRQPQPVEPIYPPEVAARAIVDAAFDGRRSSVLGVWNRGVVLAARMLPGVAAHFGATTAVDGQQTEEPVEPDRPANLHAPADADRDHGASGRFGGRSSGMLTPAFWRSFPDTLRQLAVAVRDSWRWRTGRTARIAELREHFRAAGGAEGRSGSYH
jgi:NAD(P)-dependent dehydrogenase (short-subunit alcohol dehydrogenase family)